jgi:hypothetical protein
VPRHYHVSNTRDVVSKNGAQIPDLLLQAIVDRSHFRKLLRVLMNSLIALGL